MSEVTPPRWDISTIYPSLDSDAFHADVQRLRPLLAELDALLAERRIGRGGPVPAEPAALADLIGDIVARTNALLELYGTLRAYIHATVTTDSYNTAARRPQSSWKPTTSTSTGRRPSSGPGSATWPRRMACWPAPSPKRARPRARLCPA